MEVYVAPISWGLGDAVVSLPVLQYFIDRGDKTYLVVRSSLQSGIGERISGLAGTIEEAECHKLRFDDDQRRLVNLRAHPIQTDYWWGSPEFEERFPGYKINDILRLICRDHSIEPSFSNLVALSHKKIDGLERTIAIVPGSDGTHKQWHSTGWLDLARNCADDGLSVLVLGQPATCVAVQELIDRGLPWRETASIGEAIDVISNCQSVVGVDTGLTHIGVQQGIPTVGLYKQHSIYYRTYPHALAVESGPCDPICDRKFSSRAINRITEFTVDFEYDPWTCEVPVALRCMSSISVGNLLSSLNRAACKQNLETMTTTPIQPFSEI